MAKALGYVPPQGKLIGKAFRNHKIVDVFDEPGSSDLTANVDFAYLSESLEGVGMFIIMRSGRSLYCSTTIDCYSAITIFTFARATSPFDIAACLCCNG